MTDPIADMLTRIRNAQMVKKEFVIVPFSKIKWEIAKILKKEGFIQDFSKTKKGDFRKRFYKSKHFPQIKIELKYSQEKTAISGLRRVSKPGRKIYAKKEQIPRVLRGLGIAIISTSRGLMTDKEARKKKLGGEVICEIW
jgi:small subunit ribosomal protein S8